MNIILLAHLPLHLAASACRMSQDNHDKSDTVLAIICNECGNIDRGNDELGHTTFEMNIGDTNEHECLKCGSMKNRWETVCGPKDAALIERVGNKFKHASILEQLVYTFDIDGISRALLQELARHRTARLTVKSSRYTLKELKEEPFKKILLLNEDLTVNFYDSELWKLASKYIVETGEEIVDRASALQLQTLWTILICNISNDRAKYAMPESYKTRLQWQIDGRNLQNFLRLRSDKSALWEIRDLASALYNALPTDHQYLYADYMYDIIEDKKATIAEAFENNIEKQP